MEAEGRQWEERALRAAVLSGDETAWRVLYERHFDALFAHVYSRVACDPERAGEAVQDCWMTVVRRMRTFDPSRGSFGAWLRGIADHVGLGQKRRWARRQRLAEAAPETRAFAAPDTSLEAAERVAWVLAGLPKEYEAVLRAKYEEEEPVAAIAASWGRSAKAVESLLSRARSAFRQRWADLDREPVQHEGYDHEKT